MSLFASNIVEVDTKNGICKIDGINHPIVGFGTSPLTGKVCTDAVKQAADTGYRMIDTATYYKNFESIAEALKDQDRRSFYIISKVEPEKQSAHDLRQDLELTLKQLQTDYLDAYLLHWPNSKIPIEKTLTTMEKLRQDQKIRHIGLSNVTVNHLKKALTIGVPITWVQIEMNPYFFDKELLNFCQDHSIAVQAWGPLGFGRVSNDELLSEIGKKYGKTACQVSLRWIVQHGCIPLPGSKNDHHIQKNFDILNFELSEDDMQKIDKRALTGTRFRLQDEHGSGFVDEFDFSYEECWPHDENMLKKVADHYLTMLDKIGTAECPSEEITLLCAKNCRKIRNGKILFEGRECFAAQLDAGKEWLGSWSIGKREVLTALDQRAVIIRYELSTEKEGDLVIIAILYLDSDDKIVEINEVHNGLEI